MAKKFNLGDYLKDENVSRLDTEQIVYIDLDRIDPDPANFYSLDGLDELAGNIELIGLQQPLRVRPEGKRFVIVSGHRRRAACMLIRDGGSDQFARGVPCIVDYGEASPAMRELRLIYANSSTRVLSAAELSKQAERVTELLYELKRQGVAFPGRMREHVAAACRVSESKLARLAAIRKNLIDSYRLAFDTGRLNEGNAYRLSQESQAVQREIFTRCGLLPCSVTGEKLEGVIETAKRKPAPSVSSADSSPEGGATSGLSFDADAYLAQRKAEDDAFFEMLAEEADPFFDKLGAVNSRQEGIQLLKSVFGTDHTGWLHERVDVNCSPKGVRLWDANGTGETDIARTWTDVYDMLCTLALSRAACNKGAADPEDAEPEWQTGDPPRIGRYFCRVDMGDTKPHENRCWWGDDGWSCYGTSLEKNGWKVTGWWPLPKEATP